MPLMIGFKTIPVQGLTDELQVLRALRINCLGSLFYFTRNALRRKRLTANLHLPLCLAFEQEHIKDVIEMPRDHFKSTCASEGLAMWRALPFTQRDEDDFRALHYPPEWIRWMRKAHDPNSRNLLVSGNITNAAKLGKKIRWHFESNSIYRALFPETLPTTSETWTDYSLHVHRPAGGSGGAHGEGTFDFLGVGSAVQSRHYNGIVIEDDLIGIKEAESQALMDKAIDYHQLLVGIFEAEDPNHELDELVIGNRWGYADLNSHLREHEPEFRFESHSALGGCCPLHPQDVPIFPEEFSFEKLLKRKQRLGNYKFSCFVAGTPVLMSDWTERPIEMLQVGDEIVGFSHVGGRGHLVKAGVQFVNARTEKIVKVTTKAGRVFHCTPDHKFLKGKHRQRDGYYTTLKVGTDIVPVYKPIVYPDYPTAQKDFDWLSGMIDGEGGPNKESGTLVISQSSYMNPDVHRKLELTLDLLGFEYCWEPTSQSFRVLGGKGAMIKLLNVTDMAKKQKIIDVLWRNNGKIADRFDGLDQVVSIEDAGEATVYNIQSSSGNYVAATCAVSNCQFLNNPSAPEDADFRVEWLHYMELKWSEKGRFKIVFPVENGIVRPDKRQSELNIAMVVDPNHSGNQGRGRCRHAIIVDGVDQDDNHYLLESWAEAASFDTFYEKIFEIAKKFQLTRVGVETVAAQKYVAHHIEHLCGVKGYSLRIDPLKGEVDLGDGEISTRKEFRIRNVLSPIAEQGRLFVQQRQVGFINEYQTFPKGRYVDQLDAFAYAPQLVRKPMDDATHFALLAENQAQMNRLGQGYSYGYGKSRGTGVFHA
jgi:hypothetical protein